MVDSILSSIRNNLGTKLISLLVAFVLWVVVLGSRSVEITKEVALELVTPSELVPATDIPEKIAFRLSGPKAFLRAILDRREDPIRVNLSGAKAGLITYRFFSDNIHLPIGVKVLSITPSSIPIKLEPVKRREVTIRVETQGVPPEGFRILRTTVAPATIRVKGAESRVQELAEVTTLPIDVSQLRQTTEKPALLDLSRAGVQVDGELPRVLIEVEASSANYRIKNVDIRVLSSYKSTIEEKTVTVFVRALPEDLKELNSLDRSQIYAIVDLRGKKPGSYTEPVQVTLPNKFGLVRVVPESVSVTLY